MSTFSRCRSNTLHRTHMTDALNIALIIILIGSRAAFSARSPSAVDAIISWNIKTVAEGTFLLFARWMSLLNYLLYSLFTLMNRSGSSEWFCVREMEKFMQGQSLSWWCFLCPLLPMRDVWILMAMIKRLRELHYKYLLRPNKRHNTRIDAFISLCPSCVCLFI